MSVLIQSPFTQENKPEQLKGLSLTFINQERADFFLKHVEENKGEDYHVQSLEFGFNLGALIEKALAAELRFEDVVHKLIRDADYVGISGGMYSTGIALLSDVWIHKETITKWHNDRFKVGLNDEQLDKMTAAGQIVDPTRLDITVERKSETPDESLPPSDEQSAN